ncbi:MAG: cyclic nucleotide-binding domain-containing protein, partial [Woeseiaceae bacterium]
MKEIPEIVQFLRCLPAFDELDPAALGTCAKSIEIAYYRKGADILTIGSENHFLHIVRSGAVELRDEGGEMVARLAETECFGFPSLMNSEPARNHSVAIEDTLIYHLSAATFGRMRSENPAFDTWFIRALSDRLLMSSPSRGVRGAASASVGSLVGRAPVSIGSTASVRQAAAKMVAERVSAMLITD